MRIIFHFLSFFFFFLLFLVVSHPLTTPSTFAQNPCPQSHPYLCDGIGPAGEEVCSAEVDCSTNNITVGSTSGPDCRQSPGYCETLSPSCPSGGGGGTVTCNPNTGWCETVSCSQGLDPSSQRYESNRQIYETRSNPVDIVIGEPGNSSNPPQNSEIPSVRPSNYRQALQDEFGITMNGFAENRYMWAWEFMHSVSHTNFPEYVVGSVVGATNNNISQMTGCKSVLVSTQYGRELFDVVFAHELGHVVYHCSEGGNSRRKIAHLEALRQEGPITPYSQQLCVYNSPGNYERETENFAELITYYLHSDKQAMTACGTAPNPFISGNNPVHYQVAEEILLK